MKLIGISGKMGTGKDTVYGIISELYPGWENKKFAYKTKMVASVITGLPIMMFEDRIFKNMHLAQWGMTVREFLQKLGTDAMRENLHQNTWVTALFAEAKEDSRWIITDVRFPNEAQAVLDHGGLLIRLHREGIPTSDHESETALDNWKFEHIIDNNSSVEELRSQVMWLLTKEGYGNIH